jgi:predicted AAA+ superfamily ATPase
MQIESYSFNMQGYLERKLHTRIRELMRDFPAVAILGPRQCGKTTLALAVAKETEPSIYVDLERPSDARKLTDPEIFFHKYQDRMVCLDEIQRKPDLFALLRGVIDEHRRSGRFLILGSASRDLIRQSSESLAGRIAYLELTPFLLSEVAGHSTADLPADQTLWLRGGFPDSCLARNAAASLEWRENFIRTFLERDIPQLGFNIPAETLRRLWRMLAHSHGQQLNSSRLGEAIGVSHTTVRSYLDLLSQTFMIRLLQPQHANLKKRLIKSPKVYVRDSGILHALLEIEDQEELWGHPVYGASWEGFIIENVISELDRWSPSFFRTAAGAEIDLVLTKGRRRIAVECKASSAPEVGKGFWNTLKDLGIREAWVISPVKESYPIEKNVFVANLRDFLAKMGSLIET